MGNQQETNDYFYLYFLPSLASTNALWSVASNNPPFSLRPKPWAEADLFNFPLLFIISTPLVVAPPLEGGATASNSENGCRLCSQPRKGKSGNGCFVFFFDNGARNARIKPASAYFFFFIKTKISLGRKEQRRQPLS